MLGVRGVIIDNASITCSIEDNQLIVVLQTEDRDSWSHPKDPHWRLNERDLLLLLRNAVFPDSKYSRTTKHLLPPHLFSFN